ncbi:hypothetical protein [Tetragenococcus muriaticus]|uniref:Uncharacterized protein n=2 Tax=Tetragenococcus muriaticus TaxID=64642 RepID=A0A091C9H4_9ENTE|nr:hypothetical protein [Tetragenococcus muriaticus]KFN92932.1 hypothetical protein TMU3MR103_0233 [Tetragenococcus muriaticus 3MR10-3]KFN93521.1 hypothetical protein TMUPMC115_0305 [Tetragenococcus muriaticus PMC-11-5]GMA48394.1 hypothetical protein GCM10025854_26440 [Tetragenococcus muriaticus]
MKKRLQPLTKGFILLECLLALSILTTTVFLLQTSQVHALKETKKSQEELQMLRVLYEETKERRYYPMKEANFQVIRDGTFSIVYQKSPMAKAKISSPQQDWAIIREK